MFKVLYKNLNFNGCIFSDILCNGEDSSFIFFKSSEYGNSIIFDNSIIINGKSNGDYILINGDLSLIKFSNLTINKIYSYGSLLNNISLIVCI